MVRDRGNETFPMSEADTRVVRRARLALARFEKGNLPEYLHFSELPDEVAIPKAAIPLIGRMLDAMSKGERVQLLVEDAELTPQQAANMLGMSRPLLMHIVKQSLIPHRRVGSHYRLNLQDVLAYQREKHQQAAVLDELVQEAQELNMGY